MTDWGQDTGDLMATENGYMFTYTQVRRLTVGLPKIKTVFCFTYWLLSMWGCFTEPVPFSMTSVTRLTILEAMVSHLDMSPRTTLRSLRTTLQPNNKSSDSPLFLWKTSTWREHVFRTDCKCAHWPLVDNLIHNTAVNICNKQIHILGWKTEGWMRWERPANNRSIKGLQLSFKIFYILPDQFNNITCLFSVSIYFIWVDTKSNCVNWQHNQHVWPHQALPGIEWSQFHNLLGLFNWAAGDQRQLVNWRSLEELDNLILDVCHTAIGVQLIIGVLELAAECVFAVVFFLRANVFVWGTCLSFALCRLLLGYNGPAGKPGYRLNCRGGGRLLRGRGRCFFAWGGCGHWMWTSLNPCQQRGRAALFGSVDVLWVRVTVFAVLWCVWIIRFANMLNIFSVISARLVFTLRFAGFLLLCLWWAKAGIIWQREKIRHGLNYYQNKNIAENVAHGDEFC